MRWCYYRAVLTEHEKNKIRQVCQRRKIGMVEFLPDDRVRFTGFHPMVGLIAAHLPGLVVVDHGVVAWNSQPSKMTHGYWAIAAVGKP